MLNTIGSGFGLPGGKVGMIDGVSLTVKCLVFSEDGLLIVKEKCPRLKPQEERKKDALSFKEVRHRIWKLVARRRERGDLSVDEKILNGLIQEIKDRGDGSVVSLSAVREILEETGLLVRPRELARMPVVYGWQHVVVICSGEIISGRLRKESGETFNSFKKLSDLPPADGDIGAERIMKTQCMFYRHKNLYIPLALKILLKENFNFPFSKDEAENFLKNKISSG